MNADLTLSAMPASASGDHAACLPLFEGGPFAKLQARVGLAGRDPRKVRQRIVVAVLVTWVPLALLAAIQGRALAPAWRQSMLLDPGMCARFLVALPLLILAGPRFRRSFDVIVRHFLDAELVKEPEREVFSANVRSTIRLRDSWVAAAGLLALVLLEAVGFGSMLLGEARDSWRVLETPGHRSLSLAGWWLVAVSEPLYDLVMLQFVYRVALWWRFLWRTSQLDLRLNAEHPDSAGGLAFLGLSFSAFRLPLFAIAVSGAGGLANAMRWSGASFMSFQYVIGAISAGLVALVVGPLVFFRPQLSRAKQGAVLGFGAFAGRQLRAFEQKWLPPAGPHGEEMLRAPDFSAVGGLSPTVAAVQKMNTIPFWPRQLIPLIVAVLLPFLPLAAMEIPLKEILVQIFKLLK